MTDSNFNDFVNEFDIRFNALDMRTIQRWNGRNLRSKENVSEHTHLVVACAIWIYDNYVLSTDARFETVIRLAMLHDSLETLRGDILSVTKDAIPVIREYIDNEENKFISNFVSLTDFEKDIVKLADLMACFLFIKWECQYPSNDFTKNAYNASMLKMSNAFDVFMKKYPGKVRGKYDHVTI